MSGGKKVFVPTAVKWRRAIDVIIAIVFVSVIAYRMTMKGTEGGHTATDSPLVTTAAVSRDVGAVGAAAVPDVPFYQTHIHSGVQRLCEAVDAFGKSAVALKMIERRQKFVGQPLNDASDVFRKIGKVQVNNDNSVTKQRLLCVMYSHEDKDFSHVGRHYQAWGRDCDEFIFLAAGDPSKPPSVSGLQSAQIHTMHFHEGDEATNRWQRVREGINLLVNTRLRQFDFMLLLGDDTVAVVDNVRLLIGEPAIAKAHDLGVPLLLGHRLVSQAVFVSQAGYILNTYAARLLYAMFATGLCNDGASQSDDLDLGDCLAKGGVLALDSTDFADEDRIPMYDPWNLKSLTGPVNPSDWYPQFRNRPMPRNLDVISVAPALFHYVQDPARVLREMSKY